MESDPACEFVASIILILRLAECWDIAILGMKAFIYCMTVTGFAKRHEGLHPMGKEFTFLFYSMSLLIIDKNAQHLTRIAKERHMIT